LRASTSSRWVESTLQKKENAVILADDGVVNSLAISA
jgi:hypothetical protein